MGFIEDALTIKNETTDGANTATRVGGAIEGISRVTETVDTIADLRALSTTNLNAGDIVYVKAHSTNGLERGLGGGKFKWITEELFETVGLTEDTEAVATTTAITRGFAATPDSTNILSQGVALITENGNTITPVRSTSSGEDGRRSYGEGETSVRLADRAFDIPDGTKVYFADDDGVHIRATGSSTGYYERVLDQGVVTPEMYGALGSASIQDTSPPDNSSALQKAYDSVYSVLHSSGFYHISNTVYVRRNKTYMVAGERGQGIALSRGGRRSATTDIESSGTIYTTDNTLNPLIEFQVYCDYEGNIQTDNLSGHTGVAYKFNSNYQLGGTYNLKISGNTSELADSDNVGTRAIAIDGSEANPTDPNDLAFSGWMHFSTFHISCSGCHTMVYIPAKTGNSFVNSIDFYFSCGSTKRIFDVIEGMTQTRIIGWYQSDDVIPTGDEGNYPVASFQALSAAYIDIMGHDLGGANRHEDLLTIASGESITIGPRAKRDNQYARIPDATKALFDNHVVLDTTKFRPADVGNIERVKKVTVTSAQILASNTTPIEIFDFTAEEQAEADFYGVGDNGDYFIVPTKYVIDSGSGTAYSTNTDVIFRTNNFFNSTGEHARFDISDLTHDFLITPESFRKSGNNSLFLETLNGDPTGGTADLDIFIFYKVIQLLEV